MSELDRMLINLKHRAEENGLRPMEINGRLWRYLDAAKFIDLLARGHLPLVRVDMLGDSFEGFVDKIDDYSGFFAREDRERDNRVRATAKRTRQFYYASCWHSNKQESDAMWKVYSKNGGGLAIATTYKSLVDSLLGSLDERVVIAHVGYGLRPRPCTMLRACMTKRLPFEQEQEVRVIWRGKIHAPNPSKDDPPVKYLNCDLKKLIERVYLAPNAGGWFQRAIEKLLKDYGLDIPVQPSELAQKPNWPKKENARHEGKNKSVEGAGQGSR